jgi:hypothetical protein
LARFELLIRIHVQPRYRRSSNGCFTHYEKGLLLSNLEVVVPNIGSRIE